MSITIRKYMNADLENWDTFVKLSTNGTLFHLRAFLSYHIDRQFIDHSLIIKKNDKIIALFPAAIIQDGTKKILFSHPGASYGGFVYDKIIFNDAEAMIVLFEQYLIKNVFNSTFFIPTPSFFSTINDQTIEYVLLWNNYQTVENYISSVIAINDDIEKNYKEVYRLKKRSKSYYTNIIKKNNITFQWGIDFDTFYPILIENKRRHGAIPTHSIDELKIINKILPDKLKLLIIYYNEHPIGGTLIIFANKNTGIIFYNMIDYNYLHLQPATLQAMEAIRYAREKNIHYLDFGVSQDPKAKNPLTPNRSLIQFKEEMGAFTIIRKAYKKTFKI